MYKNSVGSRQQKTCSVQNLGQNMRFMMPRRSAEVDAARPDFDRAPSSSSTFLPTPVRFSPLSYSLFRQSFLRAGSAHLWDPSSGVFVSLVYRMFGNRVRMGCLPLPPPFPRYAFLTYSTQQLASTVCTSQFSRSNKSSFALIGAR